MTALQPAVGYLFKVQFDGFDLGAFTKVDGLTATFDVLKVKEGGENGFVHQLPGRIEYENIKLTRPVDAQTSAITAWISSFSLSMKGPSAPMHAAIEAVTASHDVIAVWVMGGVVPVKYTGPSFKAGSSEVLTETLEFAHTGFLEASLP